MGCTPWLPRTRRTRSLPEQEAVLLASETSFSVSEVQALFELYKDISSSITDDEFIDRQEFRLAVSKDAMNENLFANRIFDLFDVRQRGLIDFNEFVRSLDVFHPDTPQQKKVEFSFKIYDQHGRGYIERQEIKEMLVAIFSESNSDVPDEAIEAKLNQTFMEADVDRDGKIDFTEWQNFIAANPGSIKFMTIASLRDVSSTFPSFIFNSHIDEAAL